MNTTAQAENLARENMIEVESKVLRPGLLARILVHIGNLLNFRNRSQFTNVDLGTKASREWNEG